MAALITRDLVALDADLGPDREDVIRALATRVVDAGRATEVESLFADAWAREQKTDTGLGGGIAIPHCRSAAVREPTLAFARVAPKVDFGGFDGPAKAAGRVRIEGKDYVMQDGDVVEFRFNV